MTSTSAKLRFLRQSPRKVRLVVDVVRGMSVAEALAQLQFSPKGAARPVRKLIESAVANAVHNDKLNKEALYISAITVDQGPTYKRFQPRAFGRAGVIRKRTSHVSVTVAQRDGFEKKPAKTTSSTVKKASVTRKAPTKRTPTKTTKPAVKASGASKPPKPTKS